MKKEKIIDNMKLIQAIKKRNMNNLKKSVHEIDVCKGFKVSNVVCDGKEKKN